MEELKFSYDIALINIKGKTNRMIFPYIFESMCFPYFNSLNG